MGAGRGGCGGGGGGGGGAWGARGDAGGGWLRAWAAVEAAQGQREAPAAGADRGGEAVAEAARLEGLQAAAETLMEAAGGLRGEAGSTAEAGPLALLDCALGAVRVEGEEWGEGQRLLEAGVAGLDAWREEAGYGGFSVRLRATMQSALNDLGALWCNRDDNERAKVSLERAEALYREFTLEGAGGAGNDAESAEKMEDAYTTTAFLLAQVWGELGDPERSARCCGLTLGRQLRRGPEGFSAPEWGQNATQLAGYYLTQGQFLVAEHLLNAASAVAGDGASCSGSGPTVPAGGDGEEAAGVRANIHIGWAKFHLSRLAGGDTSTVAAEEDLLGGALAFEPLALPGVQSLRGVRACSCWSEAREAFNASALNFRGALTYYRLDGWVTEHCTILIDVSNLYKQLVPFEADLHRKCVLHRHRAKALEPLLESLNAEVFENLVHSIHLELAETYRAILELKLAGKRPRRKLQSAGGKAARHYRAFLGSFEPVGDPDEALEDGVEAHVLLACCNLSRVQQKVAASDPGLEKALLQEALSMLEYVTGYWSRHPGVLRDGRLAAEQPLIEEMRDLLRAKLQLLSAR